MPVKRSTARTNLRDPASPNRQPRLEMDGNDCSVPQLACRPDLQVLFSAAETGVAILDADLSFTRLNLPYARACGGTIAGLEGLSHREFGGPQAQRLLLQARDSKTTVSSPIAGPGLGPEAPASWDLTVIPLLSSTGSVRYLVCCLRDPRLRPPAEQANEMAVQVLALINGASSLQQLARGLTELMARVTGCAAVGLRLQQGDDFPFYVSQGFSNCFLQRETSLYAEPPEAAAERPGLPCFCGRVICGSVGESATARGSLHIGDAARFVERCPPGALPAQLRGTCLQEGYRSLLIIPLRLGDEVIGTFHLCDPRPYYFPETVVALLEQLADNVALALAHHKSVAALRQTEDRYYHLLESVNTLILGVDPEGRIIFASNGVSEFLGRPRSDLLGRPAAGTLLPAAQPLLLAAEPDETPPVQTALEAPQAPHEKGAPAAGRRVESEYPLADGRTVWVIWNSEPIYDEEGNLREVLWLGTDITDHKQAEQELRCSQKQLRSMAAELALVEERDRRRLAAGIDDDLVQSLAACKLQLGLLRQQALPTDAAGATAALYEDLSSVIQRLRQFSFEVSPAILYHLGVRTAVHWLGDRLMERYGLPLTVRGEWNEEALSESLRVMLYQAARELLTNCARHACASEAAVTLRQEDGYLQVEVSDDGTGFDPEQLDEPASGGGYGLFGLRERLAYLGGEMQIASAPGSGTTVTVTVPHEMGR